MTSPEEANTKVVREICQSLADRNVDGIMAQLDDDANWTIVGRPDRFRFGGKSDKAGSRATLEGFLGGFSEFSFVVDSITAQDDRVAVRATSQGKGPGGAVYQNNYLMLYRLENGKVIEALEYFDPFEVLAYVEQMA
ncbi:MAG: nuclear transport factor 2 family protein [Sphingobium sp.]